MPPPTVALRYVRLTLEAEEIARPDLRVYLYHQPEGARHILRPLTLNVWLPPLLDVYGTIPGDWESIGYEVPLLGQANIALADNGESFPILFSINEQTYYVNLGGRVFRAAFWHYVEPPPRWTWRAVQWADRIAITQLLGETVCLWPQRADGHWGAFTEPLTVTTAYARTAENRFGIGMVPTTTGGPEPLEGGTHILRRLVDLDAGNIRHRHIGLTQELRPPFVLWAAAQEETPLLYIKQQQQETPVWTLAEGQDAAIAYRLVLPDSVGTYPDIWKMSYPGGALVEHRQVRFCVECAREGHPHVPIVDSTHALCVQHYTRWKAASRAPMTSKSRKIALRNPRLSFNVAPTTPSEAPEIRPGMAGDDDD